MLLRLKNHVDENQPPGKTQKEHYSEFELRTLRTLIGCSEQ